MSRIRFLKFPNSRPSHFRPVSPSNVQLDSSYSLPSNQHLYRYNERQNTWLPLNLPLPRSMESLGQIVTKFRVATWNIEFSTSRILRRTEAILKYLQTSILATVAESWSVPTIILFQEVDEEAFPALLSNTFLRDNYDLTDISIENFAASYGTVTFVPRPLTPFVSAITRIPFENTCLGRDALVVDLDLPRPPDYPCSFPFRPVVSRIRICNVHLESLRGHGDKARPKQLRFVSSLLSAVEGGLVAGDMNAIAPTDCDLPRIMNLVDCWEVANPAATAEAGYTWGYQPPSRFPPGRLDKVLTSGCLAPMSIERFGIDQGFDLGRKKIWLSDHYGLLAEIKVA